MNKMIFLSIVAAIGISVSLLLAFFLLTVKTSNKQANRLFAAFLILSAIDLSGFFIFDFISNHLNLEIFRWTTSLLGMPLFYLYVLSVCYTDFKLKPKHLLHAFPFVLVNLILTPRFYLAEGIEKNRVFEIGNTMPEMYSFQVIVEIQYLFYIISVFLILKKYREIYLENYASAGTSTYKWLMQMTIVFFAAHSVVAIKNLLKYTEYKDVFLWANIFVGLFALCITCWFVLKALNYPELFRGIDSKLELAKDILPKSYKISDESRTSSDPIIASQIESLKEYMIVQEPYLDPSLTIQQLSNQINIPVRDLSVLINHHMNQHFFDFVNEYRIQKAMGILKNQAKKDLTVLEILYEVGFNSKSSFNTSFKKYTELTPTAYRNSSF
ncbi:helix-turn-helix domain-containing protein [Flavobacterium sp. LC2016-23]|uniref:helix-turn-helix domain-containing protein n=1 Tax=Flavobacterium sp. LC2016-23 TaxID=2666330 RepID=UPI0012B030AD|nr:response regulator transcription factor [Flavobacterium sp. LC2016-23]MRX42030.1 helix-turn-helix domain-containing protein [Flavobacterium sp. LC2016-23]